MSELKEKVYMNALIGERLCKLDKRERQKVVCELLKHKTEGELSRETGIAKSTIHDWKTLRQINIGVASHVSLSLIYRKLVNMQPKDITDWGRIQQIHKVTEELLRKKEY